MSNKNRSTRKNQLGIELIQSLRQARDLIKKGKLNQCKSNTYKLNSEQTKEKGYGL